MSLLSDVRTYVDERIKAVDPNLGPQITQVFGDDNPAKNLHNKKYNLIFGGITNDRDDSTHFEELTFQIDIYVKPSKEAQQPFDDLMDKARCIRDQIIKKGNYPKDVNNNYIFHDMQSVSISPIQELTNDKAFRMQLEFIVTSKYQIV